MYVWGWDTQRRKNTRDRVGDAAWLCFVLWPLWRGSMYILHTVGPPTPFSPFLLPRKRAPTTVGSLPPSLRLPLLQCFRSMPSSNNGLPPPRRRPRTIQNGRGPATNPPHPPPSQSYLGIQFDALPLPLPPPFSLPAPAPAPASYSAKAASSL